MGTDTETLSVVLAKLVTNPCHVEKYINNIEKLLADFTLSNTELLQLRQFFDTYGAKFLASTRLLKKRRWDNIKQSLQLLPAVFSVQQLNALWESYTQKIDVHEEIPKNPLIESMRFCDFILSDPSVGMLENALVLYEFVRNKVIVSFSTDFTDYFVDKNFKYIHPSFVIKKFNCNVSSMVKAVNQGKDIDALRLMYQENPETILFYKNWKKEGVASLKINSQVEQFILSYEALTDVLSDCGVIHERGGI